LWSERFTDIARPNASTVDIAAMPRYKRSYDETELDVSLEQAVDPQHGATLERLRNMWEFASLMQYIFLFGQVVKIGNDFDIEVRRPSRPDICHKEGHRKISQGDTDTCVMIGPRNGVFGTSAVCRARPDRPAITQIRIVSSRPNVSTTKDNYTSLLSAHN